MKKWIVYFACAAAALLSQGIFASEVEVNKAQVEKMAKSPGRSQPSTRGCEKAFKNHRGLYQRGYCVS